MAILDSLLEFADNVTLGGATGRAAVGNTIDLQGGNTPAGIQDLGGGQPLYLVVQVTAQADSATDTAAVAFELVSDAQDPPAADGTETLHLTTESIGEADLVPGYRRVFTVPLPASVPYERYLGIQQNVSGEALTAGAIDAFLTLDPFRNWQSYPDADN